MRCPRCSKPKYVRQKPKKIQVGTLLNQSAGEIYEVIAVTNTAIETKIKGYWSPNAAIAHKARGTYRVGELVSFPRYKKISPLAIVSYYHEAPND